MREAKSTCRICPGICGVILSIDDQERVTQVRGDRAHLIGRGYACPRGLQVPEAMNSADRLHHPMKRRADGNFERIPLDAALDDIAERLRLIIAEDGGPAVAMFKGTQAYLNATAARMIVDWMAALGSPNYFTTQTIDQSSHLVTRGRMGFWDAGKHRLGDADVALMIGTNPLVSLGAYGLLNSDPAKRLKSARQRGLKLIVIDPRRTETAVQADCHLQVKPGEDPTLLAGLIRIILAMDWQDHAFCDAYVDGLEALRSAVAPFTPDYVRWRAGIENEQMEEAAAMFAREARRGIAMNGTGGSMGPRSNLTDHLVECLNALCGRMLREGEKVPNPGVLAPSRPFRAEVVPPDRSWETSLKSSTGHGTIYGQRMSGILADEMLLTGEGRIRALFVQGGNPAVALPNQAKAVAALKALDLLVSVEPFMTATALLSDYIIPPKLIYERADIAMGPDLEILLSEVPFAQYLPAVVAPPAGSEVIDDWYLYWSIAKRLGLQLSFSGVPLDTSGDPPSTDDLLGIMLRHARVPLDIIRQYPEGRIFVQPEEAVLPAREGAIRRLQLAPADIITELGEVAGERVELADSAFPFRLISRRSRAVMNSWGRTLSEGRKRGTYNPLQLHPDDLRTLGLAEGDPVKLIGSAATVPAIVTADPTLRSGVVSMSHCWGLLPGDEYAEVGVATSQLVRTDAHVEAINAMPVMTAIPVRIVSDRETGAASGRRGVTGRKKRDGAPARSVDAPDGCDKAI